MDGAEAGAASGPEHTPVVCEDPDTPRRPRQARKDPGRPRPYPHPTPLSPARRLCYTIPGARFSCAFPRRGEKNLTIKEGNKRDVIQDTGRKEIITVA